MNNSIAKSLRKRTTSQVDWSKSGVSIGTQLRKQRQRHKVSIEELSNLTRIPKQVLARLEEDRFAELPNVVFLRGYVKAYANALGFDAERILSALGKQLPKEETTLPPSVYAEGSRVRGKFGFAVALLLALLLVGLALTIALRPRKQMPVELSQVIDTKASPGIMTRTANGNAKTS